MKVAVTGSGGFIGQHLVPKLINIIDEVVEISRSKGYDISNWDSLTDLSKCDVIIHLAAKTFVPDSFENPRAFYSFNTLSTINMLELARLWKAKVIYMSSYFYGPPQYIPVDEKHPIHPHNPYAHSKYISEELCRGYSLDFNIPVIAFRPFNIYGPGQKGYFLIPEILEKIKTEHTIKLKDPRPKRDFIHVSDVVSAILLAIEYKNHSGFEVFNLGTGNSVSVKEIVSEIAKQSRVNFDVEYTHEYREGEVLDSIANCSKLINKLNWKASVSLKTGISTILS